MGNDTRSLLKHQLHASEPTATQPTANQNEEAPPEQDEVAEQQYKSSLTFFGAVASLLNGGSPLNSGSPPQPLIVGDANKSLEAFLRFVLAERTRNIDYMSDPFESLMQLQPICLRAVDGMADRGRVSNSHRMTLQAQEVGHCFTRSRCVCRSLPSCLNPRRRHQTNLGPVSGPIFLSKNSRSASHMAAPEETQAEISWAAVAEE